MLRRSMYPSQIQRSHKRLVCLAGLVLCQCLALPVQAIMLDDEDKTPPKAAAKPKPKEKSPAEIELEKAKKELAEIKRQKQAEDEARQQAEQKQREATQRRLELQNQAHENTAGEVKLRNVEVQPNTVERGGSVKIIMNYEVRVNGVQVADSWTLMKDGHVLAELPDQKAFRTSGAWNSDARIPIPTNADPGTYFVVGKVGTANSEDSLTASFTVR